MNASSTSRVERRPGSGPTESGPTESGPRVADHLVSAVNAWIGDYLAETDNGLQQTMAFYRGNRPVAPEALEAPVTGKICVLVHGLGSNEAVWKFSEPHQDGGDYGELLQRRCGYMPLYVRFNTGLRISDNGKRLAALFQRLFDHHGPAITELICIAHSMGGLVVRSACHIGSQAGHDWVSRVSHAVYLGSPHLGAPLEKFANVASYVLGLVDTTATRVISDVLKTRSKGVKDLRFGNLVDQDWFDYDPDELLNNRRVPIPWLATARHHRVVGQVLAGVAGIGDMVVSSDSAAGCGRGAQPGAPGSLDVQVMPGLDHLTLAHHPEVYQYLERWINHRG